MGIAAGRPIGSVIFWASVAVLSLPAIVPGQEVTFDEARRAAHYSEYWALAAASRTTASEADRLNAAIDDARKEFGGRGPALARYFVDHVQAAPGNASFHFLFRAVGDLETTRVLIDALLDPPPASPPRPARDREEIVLAIHAILKNEPIRNHPGVVAALDSALARSRRDPRGEDVSQIVIRLLAKCGAPEAPRRLRMLAKDPDRTIRVAAIQALAGSSQTATGRVLQAALTGDPDPGARARAAAALADGRMPVAAASLSASLAFETDRSVIDTIVSGLTTLGALPADRAVCLDLANRCWDPAVARAPFECWRATATRQELISQTRSASWPVRVLAFRALTWGAVPPLPARDLGGAVRPSLLRSMFQVLARPVSSRPAPGAIAEATARHAREAIWELSDRDMRVALDVAERMVPASGPDPSTGRFGEFADLAARDRQAYVSVLRPPQLMAAGAAAIVALLLLAVRALRKFAAAMLVSVAVWAAWFSFHPNVRELLPLPLAFLTVSSLGFLTAGIVSGLVGLVPVRGWIKVIAAPLLAGGCAYALCSYTRTHGLFPIGWEGAHPMSDALRSAVFGAPLALAISLGFLPWKS